jgi:hypothetical protein
MRRFAITAAIVGLCLGWAGPPADAAGSLTLSTPTLFPATSSVFYSATVTASGGTAPYVYSLSSGLLPNGLSLAPSGTVSGVPDDSPGLYSFTVQAVDAKGATGSTTLTLSLATPVIVLASAAVPAARVGASYRHALFASGGSPRYIYSLAAGSTPDGLDLSSAGVFSGTPRTPGVWLFTVQIIDNHGIRGIQTFRFLVQKAKAAPRKTRLRSPR